MEGKKEGEKKPSTLVIILVVERRLGDCGQWLTGPSFNQGVGGSIPALVDVSLSQTLDPELLPVSVSTVYECNMIASRIG